MATAEVLQEMIFSANVLFPSRQQSLQFLTLGWG
jgi:hypothetical protein